jgi:hypothetical protein
MENSKNKVVSVITTIQEPTECMEILSDKIKEFNGILVVAGDTKGPFSYSLENAQFLDIKTQESSGYRLAEKLPTKHYARKNIAYLHAIKEGATCIYETDDDNKPNENWMLREQEITAALIVPSADRWVNAYKYFTSQNIWPRGLPLNEITTEVPELDATIVSVVSPIQQGLVNNAPDVDAIWRLVFNSDFNYDSDSDGKSIYLSPGNWCPFNTQSTWWWPVVYPLLYIPSYCSFRMCDIWKSFIAQRCLWELGHGVTFHSPEAIQVRNEHNIMKDFTDEIPGYLENEKIREILSGSKLKSGAGYVATNLRVCYADLIAAGIFPEKEMELVDLWLEDLTAIKL